MLDGSKAPIDGGLGRATPSISFSGAPVAVPGPTAGDSVVTCRLVGSEWKCTLAQPPPKTHCALLPMVSPLLGAPFTVLPWKRLFNPLPGALLYRSAP